MKKNKGLVDFEFYFVLYVMALVVVGWFIDINGLFNSNTENSHGLFLVPLFGSIVGYLALKIAKKKVSTN
jgi:hypothetical protein